MKLSFWVRNCGGKHPNLVVRVWLRKDAQESGISNRGIQGPHWNHPDIVKRISQCLVYLLFLRLVIFTVEILRYKKILPSQAYSKLKPRMAT